MVEKLFGNEILAVLRKDEMPICNDCNLAVMPIAMADTRSILGFTGAVRELEFIGAGDI